MSDVIFLAARNDRTDTSTIEVLSCKTCGNKAWTVVYESGSQFPQMRCTCCGTDGGVFGWVQEDGK